MLDQLSLFRTATPVPSVRQHHVQLGHRVVSFALRRAARRRLSMTIDERGLRVGAPLQLALRDIEQFIVAHAEWVLAKLEEFEQSRPSRHLVMRDGVRIPLLDAHALVNVVPGANRVRWLADNLILEARADADLQALARRGLQKRALQHFQQRVMHYAQLMRRPPPLLSLSSARTRWGSCSSLSGIRLNWRLIHLPPHLVDYVIAHELAHLLEMNHSPRFWAEVEKLYPDWRSARQGLKSSSALIPLL